MKAYTDYPIIELGDIPNVEAPIREVEVISYDGVKRCKVVVENITKSIKAGYLYQNPGRSGKAKVIDVNSVVNKKE